MAEAPRADLRILQVWSPIVALTVVVAPAFGLMLAPVPVALSVARGHRGWAGLTGFGMAAAAGIGFWHPAGAVIGFAASSVGMPIGIWAAIGVPLGRILARTTMVVSTGVVGVMAFASDQVDARLQRDIAAVERAVEEARTTVEPEVAELLLETQRTIVEHWPYVLPGLAIGLVLIGECFALVLLQRLLLRSGGPPIPGRFRDVRPPEWLVWLAILAAALWYADREMSNESIRLIAWNGAIALAAIYWLNGLGILVTMATRLRQPLLLVPVMVLMVAVPQIGSVLTAIGFFDTWIEFRNRLAGIPPARPPDE